MRALLNGAVVFGTTEIGSDEHVVGRVLNIGGKWGVINSFSDGAMVVCGGLRAQP